MEGYTLKVSYEYDQDPRYGWVSVNLEGETTALIVVHTESGSLGFNFNEREQKMVPTCICNAWNSSECSCPHLEDDYWD